MFNPYNDLFMIKKLFLICFFMFACYQTFAQRAVVYTTTADGTKRLEKIVKPTSSTATSNNITKLSQVMAHVHN